MENPARNFILNESLYKRLDISNVASPEITEILFFEGPIDCFCPYCKCPSVFLGIISDEQKQRKINLGLSSSLTLRNNVHEQLFGKHELYRLDFVCSRDKNHCLTVVYKVENHTIEKIGQSPSLFEIQRGEFKEYKKILGDSYDDLYNAIMFYSSGFGVASFAHLRRILENYFVKKAYEIKKIEPKWDDKAYKESKFVEKLDLLQDLLPETLIENQRLYSIVSKGIHELKEEECLLYFEAVKACIFLSLDDILEEERRTKSKIKIKAELSRIDNKIIGGRKPTK